MNDIPTFSDAAESAQQAVSSARAHSRTLIPWLPDPPQCPACDALLYASATFDPREAFHVASWHCVECDDHYPREPEYGEGLRPGPRRGATKLHDLLTND